MATSPLASYRVVDLTRVLAGPFCTMQLGDLGADVIKVESPEHGDDTRSWGPPFVEGESTYFMSVNRNKRSLTLNLKSAEGRDILWRLLEGADVLVENFRPGKLERLGFGYLEAASRLPQLVYCSISGFGQTGPDRLLPGYDVLIQGESGLMSLTGQEDGPPLKLGASISDLVAGMVAVQGILAALLERGRSGLGQLVDVSMLDASVSLLTYQAASYFATGEVPRRRGNEHPSIVPYATYACADGTLILAVGNDGLFARFCEVAGAPELAADRRFATATARVENRKALDAIIERLLLERSRAEWLSLLREHGVPCGTVKDVSEVVHSAQLAARAMLPVLEHPRAGRLRALGSAIQLSRTPPMASRLPPPLLGQHTQEILRQELGMQASEIAALRRGRVI